jgi:Polysaccharide lyase
MRVPSNTALALLTLALALLTAAPASAATGIGPARVVGTHRSLAAGGAPATASRPAAGDRLASRPASAEDKPKRTRESSPESTPEPVPEPQPETTPEAGSEPSAAPLLEAGFEQGLAGWNTAGLGETMPSVVSDVVRSGAKSAKFLLSGDQNRSELILGGSGGGDPEHAVRFYEGDEYWYGFSFYIVSMVYGRPGAHNLIMQFKSDDGGSPAFGLQLWDYQGHRGFWSHSTAMGGDRFLAPAAERRWHDVIIHFKASRAGAGFYEVFLDGDLVDARSGVSMIVPTADHAYIKDGIYRNGGTIPGTSEIRLDDARLGTSRAAVSAN